MVFEMLRSIENREAVVTRVSVKLKWVKLELKLDSRSGGEACGRQGTNGVNETSWAIGSSCNLKS